MSVDAHVAGGAGEALMLLVGNMLARLRVDVLLGQAEVDDVQRVRLA